MAVPIVAIQSRITPCSKTCTLERIGHHSWSRQHHPTPYIHNKTSPFYRVCLFPCVQIQKSLCFAEMWLVRTVITTGCSGPGRDTRPEWVIDWIPSSVSCTFLSFLNYHQCIVKSSTNSCSSVYLPATCSSGLYSRRLAQDLILRRWWITCAVWPGCLCLSDCICDQAPMRTFSLSEISRLMLIFKHDLRSTLYVNDGNTHISWWYTPGLINIMPIVSCKPIPFGWISYLQPTCWRAENRYNHFQSRHSIAHRFP